MALFGNKDDWLDNHLEKTGTSYESFVGNFKKACKKAEKQADVVKGMDVMDKYYDRNTEKLSKTDR